MAKKIKLSLLADKVSSCIKCPSLVAGRLKTVFGEGNPDAELMIIGEAPGKTESETGIPFCGAAGTLLNNMLKAANWNRQDIYITNIIRCRPPQNRNPLLSEINNCRCFLDKQIEIINPKILFLLGSVASRTILGMSVTTARGRWHQYKDKMVLCSYHPAFILRQDQDKSQFYKKQVWEDIKILMSRVS